MEPTLVGSLYIVILDKPAHNSVIWILNVIINAIVLVILHIYARGCK
jgi:hypothetical protein